MKKKAWKIVLTAALAVSCASGAVFASGTGDTAGARNVRIGVQNQPIGDLTLTEPAKAVWDAKADGSRYIEIILPEGFKWETLPTVTVTAGDIAVLTSGVKDVDDRTLRIPLKYPSAKASELTLAGSTVTLDRTVPEGLFAAKIGGTALIKNYSPTASNGGFDKNTVGEIALFRVITPADAEAKASEKTVLTVGETDFRIGTQVMHADAAPYVDEEGRVMVPLRVIATAMHLTDDQIAWNERERTVVVFKGNHTISVKVGETQLVRDGVAIPMDSAAVIKNGRLMLPIRAVGQALSATLTWDGETRMVTIQ